MKSMLSELSPTSVLTFILVMLTLIGVAVGRYPWLRMNRATIALVGGTLAVVIGAMTLEQAYAALDLHTLVLLFAMMVLNVNLRLAGFFRLISTRVVRLAHSPRQLLALLILAAGVLSALFLNDTIVLMLTPLVLEVTVTLKRNPIPYLVGLTAAANIGSTATITGNPQNMLIGISSGIPYATFTAYLAPVALVGMGLAWLVLVFVYRQEFAAARLPTPPEMKVTIYRPLLNKSLLATGAMLVAFVAGVPIPLAAMTAAAILLITRRLRPERVFEEIDWGLLIFFAGLFIVTGALETSGISQQLFTLLRPLAEQGVAPLTGVAVVLSNLISNVPAVMLFRPLIPGFPLPQTAWLTLAMATTLAGNLTLLGSVANLIVAETAKRQGVNLTFTEYLKAGVPITILSLLWGVVWLMIVS